MPAPRVLSKTMSLCLTLPPQPASHLARNTTGNSSPLLAWTVRIFTASASSSGFVQSSSSPFRIAAANDCKSGYAAPSEINFLTAVISSFPFSPARTYASNAVVPTTSYKKSFTPQNAALFLSSHKNARAFLHFSESSSGFSAHFFTAS